MITDRLSRFFKSDDHKRAEADDILDAVELLKPELEARALERDRVRVARVQELLQEREAIERERDEIMPALSLAVIEAENRKRAAEAAVEVARRQHKEAVHSRLSAGLDFRERLNSINSATDALAPAIIDATIAELSKLLEETRKVRVDAQVHVGRANPFTGERKRTVSGNADSLNARTVAILQAIETARALKTEPLSESEIATRLEELTRSLPEIHNTPIAIDPKAAANAPADPPDAFAQRRFVYQ